LTVPISADQIGRASSSSCESVFAWIMEARKARAATCHVGGECQCRDVEQCVTCKSRSPATEVCANKITELLGVAPRSWRSPWVTRSSNRWHFPHFVPPRAACALSFGGITRQQHINNRLGLPFAGRLLGVGKAQGSSDR
jgi:hypothetical protein